ncbi:hypothetical protein GY45DRAFT_418685 [Cubamyces sp. BRFM 1775]|nr:hypothetical protein GY45DRAFT_418685 [Cubamyces sp. BRFM 1775]
MSPAAGLVGWVQAVWNLDNLCDTLLWPRGSCGRRATTAVWSNCAGSRPGQRTLRCLPGILRLVPCEIRGRVVGACECGACESSVLSTVVIYSLLTDCTTRMHHRVVLPAGLPQVAGVPLTTSMHSTATGARPVY